LAAVLFEPSQLFAGRTFSFFDSASRLEFCVSSLLMDTPRRSQAIFYRWHAIHGGYDFYSALGIGDAGAYGATCIFHGAFDADSGGGGMGNVLRC
jgi:hypothetical protein